MATNEQKRTMAPFLSAITASNAVKGQLADAYYKGEILRLVGAIDSFAQIGANRIRVFLTMLATLPGPKDWGDLQWLLDKHPFFNGTVEPTTQAIRIHWLEVDPRSNGLPKPSWQVDSSVDPRDYWGPRASGKYGRFVQCEVHGWRFCTTRTEENVGTVWKSGNYDCTFEEELACGCAYICVQAADEKEPQRLRI